MGAQRRDKQLAGDAVTGGGVGMVGLEAGIIDKQPVAALVDLAHRQAACLFPRLVVCTEGGAPVALGVQCQVLLMEQFQRDSFAPQLQVDGDEVGLRAQRASRRRRWVQQPLQLGVQKRTDGVPVQTRAQGPLGGIRDGPVADRQRRCDQAVTASQQPLVAEESPGYDACKVSRWASGSLGEPML